MKNLGIVALAVSLVVPAFAAETNVRRLPKNTRYFSCTVTEPTTVKNKKVDVKVTVKFAIQNLDMIKGKGDLIQYPGSNEEMGMIAVSPEEVGDKKRSAIMTNLNGQGGDLRIEGYNIRLWGDGAGYQFTDLVLWDIEQIEDEEGLVDVEGFVRDYGPAYGNAPSFKQFITCKSAKRLL